MLQRLIDSEAATKLKVTGQRVITVGPRKKIIASCESLDDKRALMDMKKKLYVETKEGKRPIYLDHDKPYEDRHADRCVRLAAKEFSAEGKDVRFKSGKLKVDGVWMEFNRNTLKLETRSPRREQTFRKDQNRHVERAGAEKQNEGAGGVPQ